MSLEAKDSAEENKLSHLTRKMEVLEVAASVQAVPGSPVDAGLVPQL